MYLEEALKIVRGDDNMELSWGSLDKWYSFYRFFDYDVGLKTNYLSSGDFSVRTKISSIREVTMADLEEKYGCKVKVVK